LAGFQVIMLGRFWVSTEVRTEHRRFRLLMEALDEAGV
jgi:hypothetical protein